MFIYLPSCNFTQSCPDSSNKIKSYLSKQQDVCVAGCCRAAQKKFTSKDTVITICLTCSAITREVSPQVKEISFWEYVLTVPDFPWPDFHGEAITVQDCWRARRNPGLMHAVRQCLQRMNIHPVEIEENFEKTTFDGMWRFSEAPIRRNIGIAPKYFSEVRDHGIELLPPNEQEERMKQWVEQYQTPRVVTYCNACLTGVKTGGADGVHLMELLTSNIS